MKAEILEFPKQIGKLLELVKRTQKEMIIIVPFYSKQEINEILRRLSKNVKLRTLTRGDTNSDTEALKSLYKRGEVKVAKNIHAKILIFDRSIVIVSSLNLDSSWERGSLDVGVLLRGKVCKKLVALVDEWWKEGEQVSQKKINLLEEEQKRAKIPPKPPGESRFSLGKRISVQGFKPRRFEENHLILNINWNPHNYRRACTFEEAKKNICCHKRLKCLKEGWSNNGGCTSSYLFEDFKYATTKSAIKKGRLVFFIAKNPNFKNQYYFVGFLYMKSSRPGKRMWGKTLHCFKGDEMKSIRFPSSGNKVIRLNRNFKKKFASRRNPQYFSRSDAISILEEYFKKTRNQKAKEILREDFGVRA